MCGRFFVELTEEQLIGLFRFEVSSAALAESAFTPRYNVAPTHNILAVRRAPSTELEFASLRWGLVPHWAGSDHNPFKTFNARSETAADKPTYREPFRTKRCLVPISGFYEWKPGPATKGVPKQPYKIERLSSAKTPEPMVLAGLWSSWLDASDPEAIPLETVSLLTRPAEGPIAQIHHRMPIMLGPARWGGGDPADDSAIPGWLDEQPVESLRRLLATAPTPELRATPVSTRVNRVEHNTPDLLDKVTVSDDPSPAHKAGPAEQPSLFD